MSFVSNIFIFFWRLSIVQYPVMMPGLAFFYAGLLHKRSAVTMMMQNFAAMGVITILWFLFVFSLCFGHTYSFVGSPFTFGALNGVNFYKNVFFFGWWQTRSRCKNGRDSCKDIFTQKNRSAQIWTPLPCPTLQLIQAIRHGF